MIRWERRSSSTNTVPRPRSARAILYNSVVRRLERLLALSEKTAEDLRARGEAITGEICLALRGGGGNTAVLTRAMAAFRRCHPQVRFSLPDCDAAALRTGLERGLIDLALWSGPVDESRYEAMPLPHRERWGLLVDASSSWAAETAIPAAALTGLTLLLPQAEEAAQALEDWAAAASVRLDPVLRYGQASWAAALVRAGAGAALCADDGDWGTELRFVPLEPPLERETALVWKKNRMLAPAAAEFLHWLRHSI